MNRVKLFLVTQSKQFQNSEFSCKPWQSVAATLVAIALVTSGGGPFIGESWLPALCSLAALISFLTVPVLRVLRDRDAPWATVNDLTRIFIFALLGLRSPLVANAPLGLLVWTFLFAQPLGVLIGLSIQDPPEHTGFRNRTGVFLLLLYLGLNLFSDIWVHLNFPISAFDLRSRGERISFPVELARTDRPKPTESYNATALASFKYMTNTAGLHACITAINFVDWNGAMKFDDDDCCGDLIQPFPFVGSKRAFLSPRDGTACLHKVHDYVEEPWKIEPELEIPFLLKLWGTITSMSPLDPSNMPSSD